ncbi:MAG: serine hydroxymethyltransferase [Ignisphaera sp.]
MLLPAEVLEVLDVVRRHNTWRKFECINLIASENTMSPLAKALYVNDMMHRYAEGKPGKRFYQGSIFIDILETRTSDLLAKLFNVRFAEVRAISGSIANAIAFRSFASVGDVALVPALQSGAHISHTEFGVLGALGIKHVEMPFDLDSWNIDVDKAVKLIESIKPRIVVLGASLYLFPHPTKPIAEAAYSVGARVVHDVAHVLGLIAGGVWPNPVHEGADAVTASTHKTFPGPQGGLILTNREDVYKLVSNNVLTFVSNHHIHRLAATAVTAIEMMHFGSAYADQITRNARAFAEELASQGLPVVAENLGYTKSHIVAIDVRKFGGGAKIAKLLEEANIIANKNVLPWDRPQDAPNPSGIRFGVQEMTRFGMKEGEFKEIAKLIADIIVRGAEPSSIRRKVVELRKDFVKVHYGFDLPEDLGKKTIYEFIEMGI